MAPIDSNQPETELDMARRHVREAEEKIAKQVRILEELRSKGADAEQAERVLSNLRDLHRLTREHLKLVENEQPGRVD